MTKPIQQYAQEWEKNAKADALWIILTDNRYSGNKWDREEFFATGEDEISRVFAFMAEQRVEVPAGKFLDFGCGVGRLSKALRRRFSAGIGVDISEKMVELAREYVPDVDFRANPQSNLSWLKDGSVDFVYSHIVLQHIPNEFQRSYIDEFLRILKPGGVAAFQIPVEIIHHVIHQPGATARLKNSLKAVFPWIVDLNRTINRIFPWIMPLKQKLFPGYGFSYEMHTLPHEEIVSICGRSGCTIEQAPATNSCETDHNGKVLFFDPEQHHEQLSNSVATNVYFSRMYFVRKKSA